MKKTFLTGLTFALLVAPGLVALAEPNSPEGITYKSGYGSIRSLGRDLYKGLKPKYRALVHAEPVSLVTDVTPFVQLAEYPDEPQPLRMVFISAGFVDLVNNVAHAKAIDKVTKGYFPRYVLSLAQESGEKELHELPNLSDKRYWTSDMMNEQLSNFNQIVGTVVGIELSHHYLGHFKKYADRLTDPKGKPVPINTLLTPDEWEASVRRGVRNALECGLSIDGVKALYDCIDKMPQRPAWTIYFLPDDVKVAKLKKTMERIEKDFFLGKEDKD